MARKQTPQTINVAPASKDTSNDIHVESSSSGLSSKSPRTPRTPRSPFKFTSKLGQSFGGFSSMQAPESQQQKQEQFRQEDSSPVIHTHTFTADQTPPTIVGEDHLYQQDQEASARSPTKGGLFLNYMASKSSNPRAQPTDTIRQVTEDRMSRDTDRPTMSNKVSTAEADRSEVVDKTIVRRPIGAPSRADNSRTPPSEIYGTSPTSSSSITTSGGKKSKPKPFSLLNRTRSIRDKDGNSAGDAIPITITEPGTSSHSGLKTAPIRPDHDRSFRDMMTSSVARNKSMDRQPTPTRVASDKDGKENGGFLHGLRSGASKGVGMSKNLFGKVNRSYSSTEKAPVVVDDASYVCHVINLPLVEQTRATRIAKRLEESRDKTEFWMPAFPWRAIDYLNYKGTETEGLYRIPGSGPEIKKWQRRFDQELDVDLFEQEDLYDINIIGSMLKSWLRELPDELLPKRIQERIAKECPGAEEPPQVFIDELANLKPYNYYLLFAITCHLSLLLAHSEKNKMDFRNLCICFQPCMKLDAVCFKYLVVHWNQCWKGCQTEDYWLDQEYTVSDPLPPSSGEGRSSLALESHDERNVSSSDSSHPPTKGSLENAQPKPATRPATAGSNHTAATVLATSVNKTPSTVPSTDNTSTGQSTVVDNSPPATSGKRDNSIDLTIKDPRTPKTEASGGTNGTISKLQPLSPIEPLSPMHF